MVVPHVQVQTGSKSELLKFEEEFLNFWNRIRFTLDPFIKLSQICNRAQGNAVLFDNSERWHPPFGVVDLSQDPILLQAFDLAF